MELFYRGESAPAGTTPRTNDVVLVSSRTFIPTRASRDRTFDEATLDALAKSIKEHGQLQPVLLRRENERLILVAGERRWRACKLLGRPTMQARILGVDGSTAFEIALAENVQRDSLLPLEEARAYHRLLDGSGGQGAVARRLGIDFRRVSEKLALPRLPQGVQDLLVRSENALDESHAILLASVADGPVSITSLAMRCVEEGWSLRTLRRALQPRERIPEARVTENLQLDLNRRGGFMLKVCARTQNDVADAIAAVEKTLLELREKLAASVVDRTKAGRVPQRNGQPAGAAG